MSQEAATVTSTASTGFLFGRSHFPPWCSPRCGNRTGCNVSDVAMCPMWQCVRCGNVSDVAMCPKWQGVSEYGCNTRNRSSAIGSLCRARHLGACLDLIRGSSSRCAAHSTAMYSILSLLSPQRRGGWRTTHRHRSPSPATSSRGQTSGRAAETDKRNSCASQALGAPPPRGAAQ